MAHLPEQIIETILSDRNNETPVLKSIESHDTTTAPEHFSDMTHTASIPLTLPKKIKFNSKERRTIYVHHKGQPIENVDIYIASHNKPYEKVCQTTKQGRCFLEQTTEVDFLLRKDHYKSLVIKSSSSHKTHNRI